jgi:hypothetical protein
MFMSSNGSDETKKQESKNLFARPTSLITIRGAINNNLEKS